MIYAHNLYHIENLHYDGVVEKDEEGIIQYLLLNATRNQNGEC